MDETLFALVLGSALRLATPLVFAAMGELVSERAGVLNLSVEGMMLTGAFFGAWACFATGSPGWGVLAAVAAALAVGALQAFLSVRMHVDQIVVGLGLNIVALGGTTLLSRAVFGAREQVRLAGFESFAIPVLRDVPIVGRALFDQSPLVYLAFAGALFTTWLLRSTRIGITITAVGADPVAADKSGVDVHAVRIGAVLYTSAFCGLAGAFYSLADIHTFVEGMTNGAGFIALVAVILGNWRPVGVMLACVFFGAVVALRFLAPALGLDVPLAVLAAIPYVAALLAVAGATGRQRPPVALSVPFLSRGGR